MTGFVMLCSLQDLAGNKPGRQIYLWLHTLSLWFHERLVPIIEAHLTCATCTCTEGHKNWSAGVLYSPISENEQAWASPLSSLGSLPRNSMNWIPWNIWWVGVTVSMALTHSHCLTSLLSGVMCPLCPLSKHSVSSLLGSARILPPHWWFPLPLPCLYYIGRYSFKPPLVGSCSECYCQSFHWAFS